MVKVGNLLVRSRKRVIDDEMDLGRVPDFRDAHLAEDFDGQRPRAVLRHGQVSRYHGNVAGMMHLLAAIGSEANHLLGES